MNLVQRFFKRLFFTKSQRYFLDMYNHGYIHETGYIKSIEENRVLFSDGSESPWLNYSFIDFMGERLKKHMTLFEYGLGNSSVYYNSKIEKCFGVEHDKDWYNLVLQKVDNKLHYLLAENQEYIDSIESFDQLFDVIIVDGKFRSEALLKASKHSSPSGVIILDDSEREEYRDAAKQLIKKGFKELRISGLKPLGRHYSSTSIFYKNENCFEI